jgi:UDP-N-acetylmuramate--alanine ligase
MNAFSSSSSLLSPNLRLETPVLHPSQAMALESILNKTKPLYFVGIGGAGMSPLALAFHQQGFLVSGADLNPSATTADLGSFGITVFIGHQAEQVPENAVLVVSTAIHTQNPELQLAIQNGYPILHRSQLLQALMHTPSVAHAASVGLSGTHGKTTLTGMANSVFSLAGLDATVIAGGLLPDCGRNIRLSQHPHLLVAELDESDGTILRYAPTFTILSNLELDHADHYQQGEAGLQATFEQFCSQLGLAPTTEQCPNRTIILNASCRLSRIVSQKLPATVTALWFCPTAETNAPEGTLIEQCFTLKHTQAGAFGSSQGDLYQGEANLGTLTLNVPGLHNLHNASQIAMVGLAMGLGFHQIQAGLLAFSGMGRRFEKVGTLNGALLVDDYAHHPTEVKATLQAAKAALASQKAVSGHVTGRLIALFQPHRFTRLQALWTDFTTCFDGLETELLLLAVYPAHEEPIQGVTSASLAEVLNKRGVKTVSCATISDAHAWLSNCVLPNDVVLSMGAGDITALLRSHPQRQAMAVS